MFIPASHAEHTVESLYAGHGREQPWTYRLLLAGVIGALVSLPFIKVDVSVRAPGMVRPATERTELKLAVSGRIEQAPGHDNETVKAGQVLLTLSTTDLDERLARNRAIQSEHVATETDLTRLIAATETEVRERVGAFHTPALRQELTQYSVQLGSYRLAEDKARGELARYTTLAEKGIATRQEWENARYEAERLRVESRLLAEQARTRWQSRLRDETTALADLASEAQRLQEERTHYTLRAPADGALLGFTGWSPGTYVAAGQVLGAISPDGALLVETHVASRDIGQVRVGQSARLQVDAFPYTEWGTLDGIVTAISGDWVGGGEKVAPAFKVMVRPARLHLNLPGGVRGELKKGLTLSASFLVARRSLLQLLYDDASAWFNPHDQSAKPEGRRNTSREFRRVGPKQNTNMNDMNMMEMEQVVGGEFTWGGFLGSGAAGGITGGITAAVSATTVAALAMPIAVGAAGAMTIYLVKSAIEEGLSAGAAVVKYGI